KCSKVYFDADYQLGIIVWDGNPDFDEYKKPFKTLLKHAETHVVSNFLSDITKQGVVSVENRKWFEKEMIPAAKERGLKRSAIVTSDNPFKKYYLNMVLMVVNKFGIPIKVFTKKEEALVWIKTF
ncbi:MAG: STAS/SEC14 domain-containing protein, partial [Cytophagales bacterium]|nr:STAS/SEC14 domain-containing protein [Cytophagales bacterium]